LKRVWEIKCKFEELRQGINFVKTKAMKYFLPLIVIALIFSSCKSEWCYNCVCRKGNKDTIPDKHCASGYSTDSDSEKASGYERYLIGKYDYDECDCIVE
jgi:hypothetical protein